MGELPHHPPSGAGAPQQLCKRGELPHHPPSGAGAPSNFAKGANCRTTPLRVPAPPAILCVYNKNARTNCYPFMAKVCIPGIFCIEHVTILLLFILVFIVTYLYYENTKSLKKDSMSSSSWSEAYQKPSTQVVLMTTPQVMSPPTDVITVSSSDRSIYTPPMKMDLGMSMMVPQETRRTTSPFSQVGILTRSSGDQILPLMGRRLGRDKFNYYTMSTNGTINTKLPLRVKGRSATSEYGCDELFCGDNVFVSGYNDGFNVTMYENGMYVY